MKKWAVGLFLCYPLLPLAFWLGLALFDAKLYGVLALPYYALLLASTWNLGKLEGWSGRFYLLAFAITCLHICGAALMLLKIVPDPSEAKNVLIGLMMVSILAVYVAATWAASALAYRLKSWPEMLLQLLAPVFLALGIWYNLGTSIFVLTFGVPAVDALSLSMRLLKEPEQSA